jgi:predicted site-specific integrase-resolvase
MAIFFCDRCRKETKFLAIHAARQVTGVSRSTVYYWMEHAWIHWRELPSGRRVICQESLSHQAMEPRADSDVAIKKSSERVLLCAIR